LSAPSTVAMAAFSMTMRSSAGGGRVVILGAPRR
jgi:hypothetical protein